MLGDEQAPPSSPREVLKQPSIGAVARMADQMNQCATESLASRAMGKAQESAYESARHERLALKLTPEVEAVLWVLQECIALGLIDLESELKQASVRRHERARDRY